MINIFKDLYGPEVIAALSGSLLFNISQKNFYGLKKFIVFFVSFSMGIVGGENAASILNVYLPAEVSPGREIGAFICSSLIVKLFMNIISKMENGSE
ncbi:TPA: putative holin [Enterobacter cloacae]